MGHIMVQQNKKARFNFIDALIILLILAVIFAAVYLVMGVLRQPRNATTGNIEFDVRISSVDESYLSLIKNGETVKDSVTGAVIGTIVDVRTEKAKYYGKTAVQEDGVRTVPTTAYEDKYDVYVKISTSAEKDERGIHTVANTRILIGSTVYFKIPSFTSISYITEFSTRAPS